MRFQTTPVFAVLWVALASPPHPAPKEKGPHGGQVLTEKGQKFEINLNQQTGKMDVYTRSMTTNLPPPDNMMITLYRDDKSGYTVRLRSVMPTQDGFIHYQGQIGPGEAPFVAFGLQFDLTPSPTKPSEQPVK